MMKSSALLSLLFAFAVFPIHASAEGSIVIGYRVTNETPDELDLEVEYNNAGDLGERVFLSTEGTVNGQYKGYYGFQITPLEKGRHKALTRLTLADQFAPEEHTSDGLEFKLYASPGGKESAVKRFPYKKIWHRRPKGALSAKIQVKGSGRKPGDAMPDFTLLDGGAADRSVRDLIRGKKALLYYFMGCNDHSQQELAPFAPIARKLQSEGWVVVGIQYFGNTEYCKFSAREHHLPGTVLADSTGDVCNQLGIGDFLVMTVDEQGRIRYRGPTNEQAFRDSLKGGPVATAPPSAASLPFTWPPRLGERYPDFEIQMQDGSIKKLSGMNDKIVLVEMIGMNCPACQAWAGAKKAGSFEGVQPEDNLVAFEDTFRQYTGGLTLDDPRIVYVQLLLFNMDMKPPKSVDIRRWSDHFHKGLKHPPIVIAGAPEFLIGENYQKTYDLVPGFQLIDRHGILRYDATGHHPRHNLWTELLPAVPKMLARVRLGSDAANDALGQ